MSIGGTWTIRIGRIGMLPGTRMSIGEKWTTRIGTRATTGMSTGGTWTTRIGRIGTLPSTRILIGEKWTTRIGMSQHTIRLRIGANSTGTSWIGATTPRRLTGEKLGGMILIGTLKSSMKSSGMK